MANRGVGKKRGNKRDAEGRMKTESRNCGASHLAMVLRSIFKPATVNAMEMMKRMDVMVQRICD
jgi:hypothetical protein